MTAFEKLPYRPCVGMMVLNKEGRAFIGRRLDGPEHVDDKHSWQMPQGGVDEGEDLYKAALRELYEETNIRSVDKIGEIKDWLIYDIPRSIVGQAWKGNTAARNRNGMPSASPARTARSTSRIPAAASTSRNSWNGAGSR